MPEIIETTVYRIGELGESAKVDARNWYRNVATSDDWHEFVFEDFETIADILGVQLKTETVRLFGGGTRQKSRIYFSGFWSQGDGACFEANYRYKAGASKAIRSHAPIDTELHRIADVLAGIQRCNFFQLTADVLHRGRYYHEHSMSISVERDSPTNQSMTADAEDTITEALRDLARWLYRQLEREYEYQTSDEVIDEALIANDYTFTETGRRFG